MNLFEKDELKEQALTFLSGTAAVILAGVLSRLLLKSIWRSVKGKEPPLDPADPETSWIDALVWGCVTGITVGLVRISVQRSTAKVRHRYLNL